MKISIKFFYACLFLLLGGFLFFLVYNTLHHIGEAPEKNSSEAIEAKAIGQLGIYTSTRDKLNHLEYSVTNTITLNTSKKISSLTIENLVITNSNFKSAKEFVLTPKHVLVEKEKIGPSIFADEGINSIEELERLKNAGYHLSFKVTDGLSQQFFDQIASTGENTILFKIKYYDFATSENININDFLEILKSANIDKAKMDTVVQYDLIIQYSDGTSDSKHIKITIPGVNIGKNGSSGNIQYRERERDN